MWSPGESMHAAIIRGVAGIIGGGGGGSEQMAQAGGKNPSRLGEALSAAREGIFQLLQGEKARQA